VGATSEAGGERLVSRRGDLQAFEAAATTIEGMSQALSAGGIAMWCDWPPPDKLVRAKGYLDLAGWAYRRDGLEGVFVHLHGTCYQARLGIERPDLAATDEAMRYAGFAATIELDQGHVGETEMIVIARGTDGGAVGVRRQVDCQPAPTAEAAARLEREWPFELLERAEQRQREAEERLESLKRSRSWRVTRPLRDLERRARRARRRWSTRSSSELDGGREALSEGDQRLK
jgi:hypothetical protein